MNNYFDAILVAIPFVVVLAIFGLYFFTIVV